MWEGYIYGRHWLFILLFMFRKATSRNLLVVPGVNCGTTKAFFTLDAGDLPDEITTTAELECAIVKKKEMFGDVMKKVGFAKCKYEDVEHCRHVRGYEFAEGSTCTSDMVTMTDLVPSSWSGLNCLLIPKKIYKIEEANIRIQWCIDQEAQCSKLPEGYGYESGNGCVTTTSVEIVEDSPDLVDISFNCKIMVPDVFSDLTKDLIILHCTKDPGCSGLPTVRLTNKSQWQGYAPHTYINDESKWGPQFAFDDSISSQYPFYTSKSVIGGFLQIEFPDIYYVSGMIIELRKDIGEYHDRFVYYEARVGLVDVSTIGPGIITVNNVCSTGDETRYWTKTYTCPQPLKGRYLTIQKTSPLDPSENDPYKIYVNEVEVDVVVF